MPRVIKTRKRNPLILIKSEGKTEKIYFKNFKSRKLSIKFVPGNSTDPEGMLKELICYMHKENIQPDDDTKIYLVVDIENREDRYSQLKRIFYECKNKGIELISSNSSFELWFLLHFRYSTKSFDNNQLFREVKHHIPIYEKTLNIYEHLNKKTDTAIKNAKKLEKYHKLKNVNLTSVNPYTKIYKIIEYINEKLN